MIHVREKSILLAQRGVAGGITLGTGEKNFHILSKLRKKESVILRLTML